MQATAPPFMVISLVLLFSKLTVAAIVDAELASAGYVIGPVDGIFLFFKINCR
jgi:hypothetical protein